MAQPSFVLVFNRCMVDGEYTTKEFRIDYDLAMKIPLIRQWIDSSFNTQIKKERRTGKDVYTANLNIETSQNAVYGYIYYKKLESKKTSLSEDNGLSNKEKESKSIESAILSYLDMYKTLKDEDTDETEVIKTWKDYEKFYHLCDYLNEPEEFQSDVQVPVNIADFLEDEFSKNEEDNEFFKLNEFLSKAAIDAFFDRYDLFSDYWIHNWIRMVVYSPKVFTWIWDNIDRSELLEQLAYFDTVSSLLEVGSSEICERVIMLMKGLFITTNPVFAGFHTKLSVVIDRNLVNYLKSHEAYHKYTLETWIAYKEMRAGKIEIQLDQLVREGNSIDYKTVGAYEVYMSTRQ